MRILTVILTALCLVPQAQAQCGRTFYPSYYQPTYHAPYYPPTVIVEKQVYVASFVPVVSVGFAAQAGPHPGLAVLAARCASCHTEGRLKAGVAKGGGFPLFARDGKTALVLSSDQAVRTWRACRGGTMPPGGKWQDEDLAKVEDLLFGKRP
jgi:mono/diheme cytochrome c family protein